MRPEDQDGRPARGLAALALGVGALAASALFFVVGGVGWVLLNLPIDQGQWLGALYGAIAGVGFLFAAWRGLWAVDEGAQVLWVRLAGWVIVLLGVFGALMAVVVGVTLFTWEGFKFIF